MKHKKSSTTTLLSEPRKFLSMHTLQEEVYSKLDKAIFVVKELKLKESPRAYHSQKDFLISNWVIY